MSRRAARRKAWNGVFVAATALATLVALVSLALILWSLLSQGLAGLTGPILTQDQPAPGSVGGLRNAIVGSLIMCGAGMAIALVVGILAGTWLSEYCGQSRYAQAVRFLNDVLLSAPSILVGLFVYEIMVAPFHGFSAWAGAVALAFLATPVVVRSSRTVRSGSDASGSGGRSGYACSISRPSIAVTRSCFDTEAASTVAIRRPSRITVIRSATPRTESRKCET